MCDNSRRLSFRTGFVSLGDSALDSPIKQVKTSEQVVVKTFFRVLDRLPH